MVLYRPQPTASITIKISADLNLDDFALPEERGSPAVYFDVFMWAAFRKILRQDRLY
jgi:hypothetical protein